MKINLSQQLVDMEGKPLPKQNEDEVIIGVLTLGDVCKRSLLTQRGDSPPLTPKEQGERWDLFKKIRDAKDYDFEAEEIVLLKERIRELYTVLVVGQCIDLLEVKEEEKKK